jgi:hypothetical protein
MHSTITFEDRLLAFLHETFPDSLEMREGELQRAVRRLLEKATGYGFSTESEIAVYVTTAYLLGENFDTEFPAASDMLLSPEYASYQKADFLQTWTRHLFDTLEGGE